MQARAAQTRDAGGDDPRRGQQPPCHLHQRSPLASSHDFWMDHDNVVIMCVVKIFGKKK